MELLTRRQVAQLLKVCPGTVDNWRKRGLLPKPIMMGDMPRWDREELIAWIKRGRDA